MTEDIITAAELATLRGEAQKWYSEICTITRTTEAADVYGGQSEAAPVVIAAGVPCDVMAQAQSFRPTEVVGEQIESRVLYTISLPPDTDVKLHDQLIITSRTPNMPMVVQAVLTPESWEIEKQVAAALEGEPLV